MKRATQRMWLTIGLAFAVTGCANEEDLGGFGEAAEAELAAQQRGDRPADGAEQQDDPQAREDGRRPRGDRQPPPPPEDEPIDRLPPEDDAQQDDDRQPPPPPEDDAQPDDRADAPPPPADDQQPPDGRRPPPPPPPADDDGPQPPPPPADDDAPVDDEDPAEDDGPVADIAQPLAPSPADNPLTADKVELGRLLYWDPILSGNGDVACATCHHPDFGYADALPLSVGVGGEGVGPNRDGAIVAGRNAPTVLNTGLNGWIDEDRLPNPTTAPMFWDVRARSLETQALGPIVNAEEMRGDAYSEEDALDIVVGRLRDNDTYAALFMEVFGGDVLQAVTAENLGKAIAAFERHLSRPDSAFDRWLAGDNGAMTAQQVRGFNTFNRVGCDRCHSGPMFSDFRLRRLGAPNNARNPGDEGDGDFRFRVPTLRNITETAPYFHGGTHRDLRAVFAFYRNPNQNPPPGAVRPGNIGPLDPALDPPGPPPPGLRFNQQDEADMTAFLRALSDDGIDRSRPITVPSGMQVGGNL